MLQNFTWLRPATDREPHCRHVPINNILRWTGSSQSPRSGRWRSHVAGIYSDCSTREVNKSARNHNLVEILIRPAELQTGQFQRRSFRPISWRSGTNGRLFSFCFSVVLGDYGKPSETAEVWDMEWTLIGPKPYIRWDRIPLRKGAPWGILALACPRSICSIYSVFSVIRKGQRRCALSLALLQICSFVDSFFNRCLFLIFSVLCVLYLVLCLFS